MEKAVSPILLFGLVILFVLATPVLFLVPALQMLRRKL
jgi:hypothetical protein